MHLRKQAAALLLSLSALSANAGWTITDIGTLSPGYAYTFSWAVGINDLGQVVGTSATSDGAQHAFLWSAQGGMVDLGDLPGGYNLSGAVAVNNAGKVAGYSSFAYATQADHAFSWTSASGMVDLGAKPNNNFYSHGLGINGAGTIVGYTGSPTVTTGFAYAQDGAMTLLSKPTGSSTQANAINDNGLIAGITIKTNGSTRATLWNGGTRTELSDMAGGVDYSFAAGLNNAGVVVGSSGGADGGHAVYWTADGQMVDLGDLPGGNVAGLAYAINEAGDIVGVGTIAGDENRAVLWRAGQMMDLNSLAEVQAEGWVLRQALGINESGQISGWGVHNGQDRGFVLSFVSAPVPEPGTWALLAAGLGLLAARVRRRAA